MSFEIESSKSINLSNDDKQEPDSHLSLDTFSGSLVGKNENDKYYFPLVEISNDSLLHSVELNILSHKSSIEEICNIFNYQLVYEYPAEIFLQRPLIIQKFIQWLSENKEADLVLECFTKLIEKLIQRHAENIAGLCENYRYTVSNSSSTINSLIDDNNVANQTWSIVQLCLSMMPCVMKQVTYNRNGAFSLFILNLKLLLSVKNNSNLQFQVKTIFSNFLFKTFTFKDSLSSLKFMFIVKILHENNLLNDKFNNIIEEILKQPYWIHLYPNLCNYLADQVIKKKILEWEVSKMIENVCILLKDNNLNKKYRIRLFKDSLSVLWFPKTFNLLIDQFIENLYSEEYSFQVEDDNLNIEILLHLLSYEYSEVACYTYFLIHKTAKEFLNEHNSHLKKIKGFINNVLCTRILGEIICNGCSSINEKISHSASEILILLLQSKNNSTWELVLKNLIPIFPILCCHASHKTVFGQLIIDFFDPDKVEQHKISNLQLFHATILMLMSRDKNCQAEANQRITWLLKSTLNKTIVLPLITSIDVDVFTPNLQKFVGGYNLKDLDEVMDLITNKCSNNQTIKCGLYKILILLENDNLYKYFLQKNGIDIMLNLLKSIQVTTNSRSLLVLILQIIMKYFEKKSIIQNKPISLLNNVDLLLHLITILSDFIEVLLVKKYTLAILFYCSFENYFNYFNKLPELVVKKLYIPYEITNLKISESTLKFSIASQEIKNNKYCMAAINLTWNLKYYNIDLILENKMPIFDNDKELEHTLDEFKKLNIKWFFNKILYNIANTNSQSVARSAIYSLKRYLELVQFVDNIIIDGNVFGDSLKKFLVLPPVHIEDLKTLIFVIKLFNFSLKQNILIDKFNWIADTLMDTEIMHHKIKENFYYDKTSKELCNVFFIELYQLYWLCLKKYNNFSRSSLLILLLKQLPDASNELVDIMLSCIATLTENSKCIDEGSITFLLSSLISPFKEINKPYLSCVGNIQRNYLFILNHCIHYTSLFSNAHDIWSSYDWRTWICSLMYNSDPLVCALLFQFAAGLIVIDVEVSNELIVHALNLFCEENSMEALVVSEQASVFCSNLFCNPKFKSICLEYVPKLNFETFIQVIYMCIDNYFKPIGIRKLPSSPKLVANICCMLSNIITLAEINLNIFENKEPLVNALAKCLKIFIDPVYVEEYHIREMCGRIASLLTLFIPVSIYDFDQLLDSIKFFFENPYLELDHCTIMVWRSFFQLIYVFGQNKNHKEFVITDGFMTALIKSIDSNHKDLCIDALKVITTLCSWLPKKSLPIIYESINRKLHIEWDKKILKKSLLKTLSALLLKHPNIYEYTRRDNLIQFLISKLKNILLICMKQQSQIQNILKKDYLDIVNLFCNTFSVCHQAKIDATFELPDVVHKFWPNITVAPKSEVFLHSLQMFVSFMADCPSACSSMTRTSCTTGVDIKTRCSNSLFHEIISLIENTILPSNILNVIMLFILNSFQSQDCRSILIKNKLFSNIIPMLDPKEKYKQNFELEEKWLKILQAFTYYSDGQISILKVNDILDILVSLFKTPYEHDSLAILRNLSFNSQNKVALLTSRVVWMGIKDILETRNLSAQHYRDIGLIVWSLTCNNQKGRLQLRDWGINKYFEKLNLPLFHDQDIDHILNSVYLCLKY
ncbi:uncharacterized protein LOC126906685 isoform X2 [Daktulosphaira vitifoliae]|uniref:uncharacterized protein LOC126906685 isoform X2 n=1 Tax=Daktulosphaira vitifoliae TaxID=58002 RepID=UPI0021AA15C0|nr:uncharacterized protein LOC126906685 isoform X2 [Daktulosphaira vitifoliae]